MSGRDRWAAGALGFAGLMFLLYPATRPWQEETTAVYASTAWVVSHLFAMLGFIAAPLGVRGLSPAGLLLMWVGAGLTLPYYGAEDFGLHGAATAGVPDLAAVADEVRFGPVAMAMFGAGMLALAAGAIVTAVAVWRGGALRRWSAVAFAAGFALFLPQFFLPAPFRIAHGVLLAAGCWWLAVARLRQPSNVTLDEARRALRR